MNVKLQRAENSGIGQNHTNITTTLPLLSA